MTTDTSQSKEKLSGDEECTWTETKSQVFKFCHKWTIHNFSYLQMKAGEVLESSLFSAEGEGTAEWVLRLGPFGEGNGAKADFSLYLHRKNHAGSINAKYALCVIDVSDNSHSECNNEYNFSRDETCGKHCSINRDALMQLKDELLPCDKLVLQCKGSYTTNSFVVSGTTKAIQFPVSKSEMHDNFGSLLETQQFSDVIFDLQGREFHAHKAILSARSAVFAAMFVNEMIERKENRVTITDTDPEVFEELLRFIYTDKAQSLEEVAAKLICVADKYAVLRLKEMCAAALFESLSADNALDILILADLHDAKELKSMTLDFIISHACAVMNTETYRSMAQTHPQLVAEASIMVVLRQMGNAKLGKSQLPQ